MQIIYRPASGPPVTVSGIFDQPYLRAQGDSEAGVETAAPTVFLRLADLPVDPEFDDPILTINGSNYSVAERRPAGLGAILLALQKVL